VVLGSIVFRAQQADRAQAVVFMMHRCTIVLHESSRSMVTGHFWNLAITWPAVLMISSSVKKTSGS